MLAKKSKPAPISLNEEQQAAVSAREGAWKIEAGPGAGKSQVLVERFAGLVREGVSPDDILSLTFTKIAAKNLRDRVENLVGKLSIIRTGSGAQTFHALGLSFAIEERDAYPFHLAESPLCPEPLANKFAAETSRKHDLDSRVLRTAISLWKRGRVSAAQAVKDSEARLDPKQLKLALAYKGYQKLCEAEGVLDFDSLIFHAVQIMDKNADVRGRWVRPFVQVDEAQDLSKIEWDLVNLVCGGSLLAVGDISQGIYSFRGSDPKLFANMGDMFPGTRTLFLSCNYRSSVQIVSFIKDLSASPELAKRFYTLNAEGPVPEIKGFISSQEEANWIVSQIKGNVCQN